MTLPPNLASRLDPLIRQGTWYWNLANRFTRLLPPGVDSDSPWIFAHLGFRCQKWHKIFFDLLSQKTMVHSHCHDCYKVVLYPRSFVEMLKVEEFQQINKNVSKLGMDIRDYTDHIWSAYWYCRGLDMAKDVYLRVSYFANSMLDTDEGAPEVIIKRGCTEFEMALGDSSKWEITENQLEMEEWLDNHISFIDFVRNFQCDIIKEKIHWSWIRWAHAHGDKSYLSMTGLIPLYIKPTTYHNEKT